jgi:DNA gyrase/topoisomerase IV subunit A
VLQDLLSNRSRILQVVVDEARAVATQHGQPRRSRIMVRGKAAVMPLQRHDPKLC